MGSISIGLIRAALEDMKEQLEHPQDLFHYHSTMAAQRIYQMVLTCLEPVKDMIGPEVRLQRTYLEGIAQACELVAQLVQLVEEE